MVETKRVSKGVIVVVVGPRADQKLLLYERLILTDESRFTILPSVTTASERRDERFAAFDKANRRFVSSAEFDRMEKTDAFAESIETREGKYGTERSEIERMRRTGKIGLKFGDRKFIEKLRLDDFTVQRIDVRTVEDPHAPDSIPPSPTESWAVTQPGVYLMRVDPHNVVDFEDKISQIKHTLDRLAPKAA